VAEDALHVFGARAGRDVDVFGFATEDEISDDAAHEIGLEPRGHEPAHDADGVGIETRLVELGRMPNGSRAGPDRRRRIRGEVCGGSAHGERVFLARKV
jgi:hypothetical protein